MFENQVIYLDDTYNFQIGFDMGAAIDGHKFILTSQLPHSQKLFTTFRESNLGKHYQI